MKRALSLIFCLIITLSTLTPFSAHAAESSDQEKEIIVFEDGSYLEIITSSLPARASGSTTGTKTYTYVDNSNVLQWRAVLTASFTYTGTSSTCTSANCSVSISNSAWYVVSNSTSRSGNTATTNLTMGRKALGVTVSKPSFVITLSCDKDGNLS